MQDILDGKIEVSYQIQQILENEEIKNDLRGKIYILEDVFIPALENISSWLTKTPSNLSNPKEFISLAPSLYGTSITVYEDKEKVLAETVINASTRPVLFIHNDEFVIDDVAKPRLSTSMFDKLTKAAERIKPVIKAVGAIKVLTRQGYVLKGTGWLVAPDILVTKGL